MDLTCSGQLSYLGNSWRKDVSFAGYGVALQVGASAHAGHVMADAHAGD